MAITYVGLVNDWWLTEEEEGRPFLELPTLSQTWKMKATHVQQFKAAFQVGAALSGGFIVDRRVKDQGMFPEASINIALPPDFQKYTLAISRGHQTASKGAQVETDLIIGDKDDKGNNIGAEIYQVERRVSFIAPQSVYTYWSSSKPLGPRFTSPSETSSPILLSSRITARSAVRSLTFSGNAPISLATAVAMPPSGKITGHQADPIPGTPWYRCQDTIAYGFWGDE